MTDERRKYPRFRIGVEVHWKKIVSADEKTAQHISHLKDLSAGGICLVLHSGITVGDTLQLEIKLPDRPSLQAKGKVMWVDYNTKVPRRTNTACEGGIEFIEIDEAARKEIQVFTSSAFIK